MSFIFIYSLLNDANYEYIASNDLFVFFLLLLLFKDTFSIEVMMMMMIN